MAIQIVFICNIEQKGLFPTAVRTVSNRKLLDAELSKAKHADDTYYWIIVAELNWPSFGTYYVNFNGIDLIARFRIEENIWDPIILTSFCPVLTPSGLNFENKVEIKSFRYLRDPLVKFISIFELFRCEVPDLLKCFDHPLDDELLFQDLTESLYKSEGYLNNFFHDTLGEFFSNQVSIQSIEQTKSFLQRKTRELRAYVQDTDSLSEIEKLSSSFLGQRSTFDSGEVVDFLYRLQQKVLNTYAINQKYEESRLPTKMTVLYIGDTQDIASGLPQRLENFNIHCETAYSIDKAIELIKAYSINVIITDFRFYDEDGRFRRWQGYHVIEQINRIAPNLYTIIVLTNFDLSYLPKFLANKKVLQFNKDKILANDVPFAKFVQLLIGQDAIINDQKQDLPHFFNEFERGLYGVYLASDDFEQEEELISFFSLQFIRDFLVNQQVSVITGAFGNLDPNHSIERNLRNLRMKLRLRRIALGLYQIRPQFINGLDLHQDFFNYIYQLITIGNIDKLGRVIAKGTIYGFTSKHLLKMKIRSDYHWRNCQDKELPLTPIERKWINKYGKDIENNNI